APESRFLYRPLSTAEPFGRGDVSEVGLRDLAAAAGAVLTPGALVSVDAAAHEALTEAGQTIPYDFLLIACGAVPKRAIAGALTFRGPPDTGALRALLVDLGRGQARRVAFVVAPAPTGALPADEHALPS